MLTTACTNLWIGCRHAAGQLFHFIFHTTLGKILIKYGLGLGLLAYVIIPKWYAKGGQPGFSDIVSRPIHYEFLLLAAAVTIAGLMITFLRWHLLVRAVGLPFSRYNAIRLGLVGYYFNTFLPGSVGGDLLKAYFIARDQGRRTVAVATVIVDRVIGQWALILFVTISGGVMWLLEKPFLVENHDLQLIVQYSAAIIGISLVVWVVTGFLSDERSVRIATALEKIPKLGGPIAEFWRACWMYRKQPRAVATAILMSLVGHCGWVLVFHSAVRAFETENPAVDVGTYLEHMIVVPVGMTVQALFPSPGGIGGGEAAFGQLYKIMGKPVLNGIAGCLSQRMVFVFIGIMSYLVYSRMKKGLVAVEERPPAAAEPDKKAPPPFELGAVFAQLVPEPLKLTLAQQKEIADLEIEVWDRLQKILTVEQQKVIEAARVKGPADDNDQKAPLDDNEKSSAESKDKKDSPATPVAAGDESADPARVAVELQPVSS